MFGYLASKSLIRVCRIAPSSGDACQPEKTTVPLIAIGSKPPPLGLPAGLPGALGEAPPAGGGLVAPPPPVHAPSARTSTAPPISNERRMRTSSASDSGGADRGIPQAVWACPTAEANRPTRAWRLILVLRAVTTAPEPLRGHLTTA